MPLRGKKDLTLPLTESTVSRARAATLRFIREMEVAPDLFCPALIQTLRRGGEREEPGGEGEEPDKNGLEAGDVEEVILRARRG